MAGVPTSGSEGRPPRRPTPSAPSRARRRPARRLPPRSSGAMLRERATRRRRPGPVRRGGRARSGCAPIRSPSSSVAASWCDPRPSPGGTSRANGSSGRQPCRASRRGSARAVEAGRSGSRRHETPGTEACRPSVGAAPDRPTAARRTWRRRRRGTPPALASAARRPWHGPDAPSDRTLRSSA